jgi:hypothetical protein
VLGLKKSRGARCAVPLYLLVEWGGGESTRDLQIFLECVTQGGGSGRLAIEQLLILCVRRGGAGSDQWLDYAQRMENYLHESDPVRGESATRVAFMQFPNNAASTRIIDIWWTGLSSARLLAQNAPL